jgi:hypothetical protein
MDRREELRSQIQKGREEIKRNSSELAKVEQAIAGLRPLGSQSLREKAAPFLAAAGTASLALLVGMATAQSSGVFQLPPNPELIISVLREGGELTDSEILERLNELGWESTSKDPLALIRSYLSRLVSRGDVCRVGLSTYGLPIQQAAVIPSG